MTWGLLVMRAVLYICARRTKSVVLLDEGLVAHILVVDERCCWADTACKTRGIIPTTQWAPSFDVVFRPKR